MEKLREAWKNPVLRQFLIVGTLCAAVAAYFLIEYIIYIKSPRKLRIVFFDAGFGNATLLTTPSGKEILIDGGQRGLRGVWDYGATTIAPTFTKFKISSLDMVVVTSLRPGNIGGLIYIMEYYPTKRVILSVDPKIYNTNTGYIEFLEKLGDWQLLSNPFVPEACVLYLNYYDLMKRGLMPEGTATRPKETSGVIEKTILQSEKLPEIPSKKPQEGEIIYTEEYKGKKLRIKALAPLAEQITGTADDIGNNSVVLKITYGDASFLITSNIKRDAELALISRWKKELISDCMVVPSNGSPNASSPEFIRTVSPQIAIWSHSYLTRNLQVLDKYFYESDAQPVIKEYTKRKIKVYHLEKTGAVIVETHGSKFDIARDVRTVFNR
ncbi:MAG: hypothetical protein AB1633_04385 [Elusimicrobiota bacterium]